MKENRLEGLGQDTLGQGLEKVTRTPEVPVRVVESVTPYSSPLPTHIGRSHYGRLANVYGDRFARKEYGLLGFNNPPIDK